MGMFSSDENGDVIMNDGVEIDKRYFTVLKYHTGTSSVAIWVKYHSLHGIDRTKIMVFLDSDPEQILKKEFLECHFTWDFLNSPFCRFRPTDAGWKWACGIVDSYSNKIPVSGGAGL